VRSTVPLLLTFVVGVLMVFEFFVPHWRYRLVTAELVEWGLILAAGAFLLGLFNLIQVNVPKIINRDRDWQYKVVMLGSLGLTLAVGLVWDGHVFGYWMPEGTSHNESGNTYDFLFKYMFTPLNATMFALLAFYIASAAFRAFRARNAEATLLLLAACLVMVAQVPLGETLPFGLGEVVRVAKNWIMDVPNSAARRAIFIGAALGAIATGLRVILGIERSHLGAD
jgi:hypothetical protein